jgi:hypothetical protein
VYKALNTPSHQGIYDGVESGATGENQNTQSQIKAHYLPQERVG